MDTHSFRNKTKEILLPGFNEKRISGNEFCCVTSNEAQRCILVFGINPAGDENEAMVESDSTYLYYLPDLNIKNRTYSPYYKPIFEVFSRATDNNAKWAWCNCSAVEIKEIIERDVSLKQYSEVIQSYYRDYKTKKYSIYIGEFFYYHMTNQAELLKLIDSSLISKYVIEMLNLHIDEIVNHGHSIDLIYINNASISHYLCNAFGLSDYSSNYDYNYNNQKYRIVFGSMLSGMRAMDTFSKARLIEEIKEHLC